MVNWAVLKQSRDHVVPRLATPAVTIAANQARGAAVVDVEADWGMMTLQADSSPRSFASACDVCAASDVRPTRC